MAMTPPTPVPRVSPIIERGAAAGAQAQLGEAEGPGVVDQGGRQAERRRRPDRPPVDPAQSPGKLTRKRVVPGDRVVEAGDADADGGDARAAADRLRADRREARDDGVGAFGGRGRDLVAVERRATSSASCSTTTHLMFVPPRSRPRWRLAGGRPLGVHQVSAVTRV